MNGRHVGIEEAETMGTYLVAGVRPRLYAWRTAPERMAAPGKGRTRVAMEDSRRAAAQAWDGRRVMRLPIPRTSLFCSCSVALTALCILIAPICSAQDGFVPKLTTRNGKTYFDVNAAKLYDNAVKIHHRDGDDVISYGELPASAFEALGIPASKEARAELRRQEAEPAAIREKLEQLILPEIEFEEATTTQVVAFLKRRSRELDPDKKGINILLLRAPKAGTGASKSVADTRLMTMSMKDIPIGELIRYVCLEVGLKYRVEQHAVVILDKEDEPSANTAGPATPVSPGAAVAPPDVDETALIRQKLEKIIFPLIEFEEATAQQVLAYLQKRSRDLDPAGVGVRIVLVKAAGTRTVTMSMKDIPLGEAIRYTCLGCGLKYRVEKDRVVVADKGAEPDAKPANEERGWGAK